MFNQQKQHYGIRKYAIGTSSVLLGMTLFITHDATASAAENNTPAKTETNHLSFAVSVIRLPRRLRLLRDQLVRKIQFGFKQVLTSIKPNLVGGPAPRKGKP
ncbi:YSIRK-type signal peptide-containing protein [Staphylococcus pseudintermedius]|nr:YSIRK-type signal peptide-containing protein [Staphylococcus pseudintermedius]